MEVHFVRQQIGQPKRRAEEPRRQRSHEVAALLVALVGTGANATCALLDCVENMMLEEGYASVTYRALASRAGVTPSLVQYYFPTLDEIFIAAIKRYSERGLTYLKEALERRADDPLRAVWEYSWDEATGALTTEFMALSNHRKSIRTLT